MPVTQGPFTIVGGTPRLVDCPPGIQFKWLVLQNLSAMPIIIPSLGSWLAPWQVQKYQSSTTSTSVQVDPQGAGVGQILATFFASNEDPPAGSYPAALTQPGATVYGPNGAPGLAQRIVSAQSIATVAGASATLIAATAGVALELHEVSATLSIVHNLDASNVQLKRSDTGAVIWDSGTLGAGNSGVAGTIAVIPYDFQGVTLPVGVGVNYVLNQTGGSTGACNLAYVALT